MIRRRSLPELGTVEPLILDDNSSNQLIVAGTEGQLQLIERIAKDLEGTKASELPRETKIIELAQSDDVGRLMPMVQQLIPGTLEVEGSSGSRRRADHA